MNDRFQIKHYKRAILMIAFTFLIASLTNAAALASGQGTAAAADNLPAIDATAPSEFETISFGLG